MTNKANSPLAAIPAVSSRVFTLLVISGRVCELQNCEEYRSKLRGIKPSFAMKKTVAVLLAGILVSSLTLATAGIISWWWFWGIAIAAFLYIKFTTKS